MHLLDCYAFCMDYIFMQVFLSILDFLATNGNHTRKAAIRLIIILIIISTSTTSCTYAYVHVHMFMYISSCAYIGNTIKYS